jgi:hypothetical protein
MGIASQQRAYRKPMSSYGWIYLGGEMQSIVLKNISVTGALVQFPNQDNIVDKERVLRNLSSSKLVDFYFPFLKLSGEAKIVRVDFPNKV